MAGAMGRVVEESVLEAANAVILIATAPLLAALLAKLLELASRGWLR